MHDERQSQLPTATGRNHLGIPPRQPRSQRRARHTQRRILTQYCAEHNLNLGRVFVDEAKSGGTVAPRRAFNDMIALARHDPCPVEGIILWSWSRFAREQDDAHFFKADLRRRGYVLISLTDNIPAGDFQYIFEALVHWKDAQYLKDLRQAVQRGHHTLAELGYSSGGFPPRGYQTIYEEVTIEGKKRKARRWVEDPATWDRARHAWRMRAEGATYKEIHAAVALFRGLHSYSDMFRNRHYLGILRWGRDSRWSRRYPLGRAGASEPALVHRFQGALGVLSVAKAR